MPERSDRKRRGAWYTPPDLVDLVVDATVDDALVERCRRAGRAVRVVDPACGDGRFLVAVAARVEALGGRCEVLGVDVDVAAVAAARSAVDRCDGAGAVIRADALARDWADDGRFDVVVGNPPFLSQMAADTTRGGSSRHGGGPYADAAVEFLALARSIVEPDGGRVAFVLPQSLLGARDAAPIRRAYDADARLRWSWWTGERVFDAQVLTCAVSFEFGSPTETSERRREPGNWTSVVTARAGVPPLPTVSSTGVLGDRCRLNANFRDEYYGMVGAVGDHERGPRLVTSGLIDPGRCRWGERPVRFAKQRYERPRVDLDALDAKMRRWADDRLVPKVLLANQTKVLEAVADTVGDVLPGVPVVAAYPRVGAGGARAAVRATNEIAAVLTSPFASAWAWHRSAGTGLSHDAIRVGPVMLADLPWPTGALDRAIAAFSSGDVLACADAVHAAYGIEDDGALRAWWTPIVERLVG